MESVINTFISRELVSKPELLPLKNDTPLIESGIVDSLSLLRLLIFLEEEFEIALDDFELVPENFNTVNNICAFIRSRQESCPKSS
jgi:acyl carrier protein